MPITIRAALLLTAAFAPALVAAAEPAAEPATAANSDNGAAGNEAEEVTVYGRGQVRSVAEIGRTDIAQLTPGSSPLKAIEKLPGVNFQSADAFGAYEWAVRISLRGFNQNQLGFTLDGIPLGDMSYGNVNGLHISRAIISDNIGKVQVSQGAGALGTASTSNLGGTIEFFSRTPQDEFGIAANGTYGSNRTYRAYLDLDTGDLGHFKGSLSYAYLNAGKYKGVGVQRAHQANAKGVLDFDTVKVTGFVNFSDRKEQDYQDLSLDQIARLGYENDNIANNFPLALQIAQVAANRGDVGGFIPRKPNTAGTTYPAPYTTVDDVYYDAGGLRRDYLTGLKVEGELAAGLTASVQGYYHNNKGQGSWFTPYVASPSGNDLSFRTTEYNINRYGVTGGINYVLGRNSFAATTWFENNDFKQARRFYDVGGTLVPTTTALTYQSNPFFTQWYNQFNTKTFQFSVADTFALTDKFSVTAGFKGNSVKLRATQLIPNALAAGNIKNEDYFQPQAGLLYKIDSLNEVYANYTENQRAFTAGATGGSPFATTQNGFNAIRSQLRPETSRTGEGGYRFGFGPFRGVVAVYYVDFSNRIIATSAGAGIVGNPTVLANAGSVRSYGVETGLTWRVSPAFTVTGSYSYNDSTYRKDIIDPVTGAVIYQLRGKTTVDTPHHIGNIELAYDRDGFYARGNLNYMSKRYFSYTNGRNFNVMSNDSVPDHGVVDAKLGYRFTSAKRALNGLGIEGSVTNLLDLSYVSTVGSNGYGYIGDNQTLLSGAPRQFFVTVSKTF